MDCDLLGAAVGRNRETAVKEFATIINFSHSTIDRHPQNLHYVLKLANEYIMGSNHKIFNNLWHLHFSLSRENREPFF